MVDFLVEGICGNFGLRYVFIDVEFDYYVLNVNGDYGNGFSIEKVDYSEVLLSVNVVFDLIEDMILCFFVV